MLTSSQDDAQVSCKRRKLETNPLKIPHIVEKIILFLDGKSIKNARQMDKLWSAEGAKVLIAKYHVYIPKELLDKEPSSVKSNLIDPFKAFLSYKSSEEIIIPNIGINAASDIELWKSFRVLGPQVHSLKLNICRLKSKLLSDLLDLLPNLKYLGFQSMLYRLKTSSIIKAITSSTISKADRAETQLVISFLNLQATSVKEVKKMEKFSEYKNIMFEELIFGTEPDYFEGIPNFEARIAKVFNKFLSNSRNTLKSINLDQCELYLSLLEFPRMTQLMCMNLNFHSHTPAMSYRFSPSFRFTENVPKLHRFVLGGDCEDEPDWGSGLFDSLFENTGVASSVKRLYYSDYVDDLTTKRLFQIFPNIEYFDIRRPECNEEMFQSLWQQGRKLKKLEMAIDLDSYEDEDLPDLDSFFTGFDPKVTSELRNLPNWTGHSAEDLENLRVNPSILDLKELEKLTIRFWRWDTSEIPKGMLAITGKHAFKLMPNTKIVIDIGFFGPKPKLDAFDEVSKLPNVTMKS